MSVKIIIGAQWGDEGKGKLVDYLSDKIDIVVRYQGGANAGHTVYLKNKKYVFHLIPGGILHPDVICLIGNGVVFDPLEFFQEIEVLSQSGIKTEGRLFISDRAHVIFPYHKLLDKLNEKNLRSKRIGTTGRGIGPAYVDKFNRCGIRVADLFDENLLKTRLAENIKNKNKVITKEYGEPPLDMDEIYSETVSIRKRLEGYRKDTTYYIHQAWREGKSILLEGAQGSLLDIDFGSYPYVTSSNPTSGGAVTGTGLPPTAIDEIIGVIKAYTTRVGGGPFPSEEKSRKGKLLQEKGHEFGATTGRPRRCGWFDAVAAQYAIRLNGFTSLALTKLDVLDSFGEIPICTKYRHGNDYLHHFPADLKILEECEPVIETIKGWQEPIGHCRKFDELPENAQEYVKIIEKICGIKVAYISVGIERQQIILR